MSVHHAVYAVRSQAFADAPQGTYNASYDAPSTDVMLRTFADAPSTDAPSSMPNMQALIPRTDNGSKSSMKTVKIQLPETTSSPQKKLPFIDSTVKAGFPSPAGDYEEKELDFNTLLVRHPASTFCLKVEGDSMSGAGIYSGDILVVDRALDPKHNDIVIASIGDEFTLKRFLHQGQKFYLHAENENFPDIEITKYMECFIFGVVCSVIRQLRS